MANDLIPQFMFNKIIIKKKFLKVIGGEFRIYNEDEKLLFFAEQEGLKLKEIFHIYTDEAKTDEIMGITTPQVIDFAASYVVKDNKTGEIAGAVKREGMKSILMDEWTLLDNQGQPLAKLKEKSAFGAFLSRFIKWIPQHYLITDMQGKEIAAIDQHFDPFVLKYSLTLTDQNPILDRRLIIGALILLTAIEGRQN